MVFLTREVTWYMVPAIILVGLIAVRGERWWFWLYMTTIAACVRVWFSKEEEGLALPAKLKHYIYAKSESMVLFRKRYHTCSIPSAVSGVSFRPFSNTSQNHLLRTPFAHAAKTRRTFYAHARLHLPPPPLQWREVCVDGEVTDHNFRSYWFCSIFVKGGCLSNVALRARLFLWTAVPACHLCPGGQQQCRALALGCCVVGGDNGSPVCRHERFRALGAALITVPWQTSWCRGYNPPPRE